MCESCKPYGDMTAEEVEAEVQKLSGQFVGLPGVVGAPLIMGPDYYVEIARHLVECGVRLCQAPIKTYEAPKDLRAKTGGWTYLGEFAADVEDPQDRIKRMAKAEYQAFLDEVEKRRRDGTLKGSPHARVKTPRKRKV